MLLAILRQNRGARDHSFKFSEIRPTHYRNQFGLVYVAQRHVQRKIGVQNWQGRPGKNRPLDQLMQVAQVQIDAMSFSELNDYIVQGVKCVVLNQANLKKLRIALLPALIRVHEMCGGQGKRNDLTGGVTWTGFVQQLSILGAGCQRTFDSMIAEVGLGNPNKPLLKGAEVRLLANGTDRPIERVAEVTLVHEKTNPRDDAKIDVTYKTSDGEKTETVRTIEVEKVKTPKVLALNAGDLVVLLDIEGGAQFLYEGGAKFSRTGTLSRADAKKFADEEKSV